MKIYIGTDHAGYELKEKLKEFLSSNGHDVVDCGANVFDQNDDYPDFIRSTAEAVAKDDECVGIIFGGSGQGEAIVANRVRGVRCTVYYGGPTEIITLSREHNDANMLSFGARFLSVDEAKNAVKLWLDTKFSEDERHKRRISKIDM
ncbi:MAG: RpiB/LacA/LacB family sugar-phosphate isomerase [Patescibacteria group bacterium]|nr:RpiB/LacA/LacB family sugar-phosphate isomerase [Patescibacteria group bacterium]